MADKQDPPLEGAISGPPLEGATSTSVLVVELKDDNKKELWGTRHTMAFMAFLGFSIVYAMRVNLSVAIVAMVRKNATTENGTSDSLACPLPDDNGDEGGISKEGEFDWDSKTQGLILGCFYYGYICTNLLGGITAERYGGRLVTGLGILFTAILTVLTPMAARASDGLFVAIRIVEGLTEGVTFPAVNSLIASWVLPEERSQFSSFIFAGIQFGTVVTLAASGVMCDSDFMGGWPSVFYVFGVMGIVWAAFWFPLVRDSPAEHPRISKYELKLLEPVMLTKSGSSKSMMIPWKSIVTSVPMWGLLAIHFGYNWVFYTLITELPTYLDQIQHFNMSNNGFLSALPYLVMYLFSIAYSQMMGWLTRSGRVSIVNVRRISMAIGGYVPMLALIALCFVGCDRTMAILVLCIAVGACGAIYSGYMCSHVDLAPRYAGMLMGLTNTFATIPGFAAPAVTGAITEENETLDAWRTVFLIAAALSAVTATIYLFTITADVQPWNYYGTETEQQNKEKIESAELPAEPENVEKF